MKSFYLILCVFLSLNASVLGQNYEWKGPCFNQNGIPTDPSDPNVLCYSVKKHKRKIPVEISINKILLGTETVQVNFNWGNKIASETEVLELNESFGIKLNIARITENREKRFLYKLQILKMDSETNCWRPLSIFRSYNEVIHQTISLSGTSVGYEGSSDYFKILEGWIKLKP